MTWALDWTERARRDLRRLDRQMAQRVIAAAERLATTEQGDVTRLQGIEPPEWRLRVGDWRVRFQYDHERRTLGAVSAAGGPTVD